MKDPTPTASDAQTWSTRGDAYAASTVHQSGPSLAKLLALARPNNADYCLDLGTGAGHTAAALAEHAAQVVGLDVSGGMLRAARKLYPKPNLEFIQAPAENTGLETASFDLITARHTLHHHLDLAATLTEAARLLKAGGRLVIADEMTPDTASDKAVARWWDALERTRDATHVRAYTLGEWQGFVAEAGLSWIVGDGETRYPIEIQSWLGNVNPDELTTEAVYELLNSADAHAREVFKIEYEGSRAVRFQLPVALMLAVKPVLMEEK